MLLKGKVLKSTGTWYNVLLSDNSVVKCRIRGKFRLDNLKTTNPIAVGDNVTLNDTIDEEGNRIIIDFDHRENYIVRKSTNLSKQKQILAANIDRAYLMVTIHSPVTHLAFIDRFLVSAESFRIPTTILFNKIDTCSDEDLIYIDALSYIYEKLGYPCFKISATNTDDILFLKSEINNQQVMISGHSGVGKSTLVNSLDSQLDLKTGAISDAHKQGKHTTTQSSLWKL